MRAGKNCSEEMATAYSERKSVSGAATLFERSEF